MVFSCQRIASASVASQMAVWVASDTGSYCIILMLSSSLPVFPLMFSMFNTSSPTCVVFLHTQYALLRVSAKYISVPFLSDTWRSNFCNLSNMHWRRLGALSRLFQKMLSKGLWSVSIFTGRPYTHCSKHSTANRIASISFSI